MFYVIMPIANDRSDAYYETVETVLRAFVHGRFAWGLDRYKGDVIERAWLLVETDNKELESALLNATAMGWFKTVSFVRLEEAEAMLQRCGLHRMVLEDTGLADAIEDAREGFI